MRYRGVEAQLRKELAELGLDYVKALQENNVAWQEAARLGRVIAQYDAKAKVRVDADTRLKAAEETARVMTNRSTAMDVFWTGLLNGEYDEGYIPAPTLPVGYDEVEEAAGEEEEPLAAWERDLLEGECD